MLLLLGSNMVLAEGHTAEMSSLWKTLGFQLSGAVETSYTQNFNNPNTKPQSITDFRFAGQLVRA